MKKIRVGKNLPFDINKLYEIQKYIYNSQLFFLELEKVFLNWKDYLNSDEYNSYDRDSIIEKYTDFMLDINSYYCKLTKDINFIDFNRGN